MRGVRGLGRGCVGSILVRASGLIWSCACELRGGKMRCRVTYLDFPLWALRRLMVIIRHVIFCMRSASGNCDCFL